MSSSKNIIGTIITIIIILIVVFFISSFVYPFTMSQMASSTPSSSTAEAPLTTVMYACNQGKQLTAAYYVGEADLQSAATSTNEPPTPTGYVELTLNDGSKMTLHQTLSADGSRYANTDESFVFWSKGNGALVLENNQQQTYTGCVAVSPQPENSNLTQVYSNGTVGFSLRFPSLVASSSTDHPDSYKVNEHYSYAITPKNTVYGVKFVVPDSTADGTNLASDTSISIETMPASNTCSASLFLDPQLASKPVEVTDNNTTYSVASSTDAGAGNRYVNIVYAIPGTNPCMAIRYFIHYADIGNYPAGAVKEFDMDALLRQFDAIRRTLTVSQ